MIHYTVFIRPVERICRSILAGWQLPLRAVGEKTSEGTCYRDAAKDGADNQHADKHSLTFFLRQTFTNTFQLFANLRLYLFIFHYSTVLSFNGPYIPVFQNLKAFRHKSLRIVIRPDRCLQEATGDQGTLGDITVSDDHLPGKGGDPVRVVIKVTLHAVHQDGLVDIATDQPVVISLFVPIPVISVEALVRQIHGTVDIGFNGGLVGSQRKEQLMHPSYMLTGFHRAVQRRILG